MPREYKLNIRSLHKHFYGTSVSVLAFSFFLASWLNSAYYSSANEDRILSIEAIRIFAPYLLLCIVATVVLRLFNKRFFKNTTLITLCLFFSISFLTILMQLSAFLNQLPILTHFLNIKPDHCLSYLAETRPSNAPHRQILLYFRARRFLKDAILIVPSDHTPDSRLSTLCRTRIRTEIYDSKITIQEAKKLAARGYIALPGKGYTYLLFPNGRNGVPYYMRKIGQIFLILPLPSDNVLESPTP
jgi:hypothetical protein